MGELGEIAAGDDLLAATANAVLSAAHWMTDHDVQDRIEDPLADALDVGEIHCIALANAIDADMFVTDEFNSIKSQFISLALDDRNILFTTPHLLCVLADYEILYARYADHALSYFIETKHWNRSYVDALRTLYLPSD